MKSVLPNPNYSSWRAWWNDSSHIQSISFESSILDVFLQVEGVKTDIQRVFESYIRELQERQKLLTSELDTFQQGELRGLRLQQENFEVELASISR